jgi:hypothetical protein
MEKNINTTKVLFVPSFQLFKKKKHRMKVREPKIVCAQDDTAGLITCPKNEKDFFGRTEEVTER